MAKSKSPTPGELRRENREKDMVLQTMTLGTHEPLDRICAMNDFLPKSKVAQYITELIHEDKVVRDVIGNSAQYMRKA